MLSVTWCRTPARSSATSKFLVVVVKKPTVSALSGAVLFTASITASTPVKAGSSPVPVRTFTPPFRLIRRTSCPSRSRAATVSEPIRPVAPTTATRIVLPSFS
jgi:hypothetical protein